MNSSNISQIIQFFNNRKQKYLLLLSSKETCSGRWKRVITDTLSPGQGQPHHSNSHCLLVHHYVLCLVSGRHSIQICGLNELNSPLSMFARLANKHDISNTLISNQVIVELADLRKFYSKDDFTPICSDLLNMNSQEGQLIFFISKFIMDAYMNYPQAP